MPTVTGLDLSLTGFGVFVYRDGRVYGLTIRSEEWADPCGWARPARRARVLAELRPHLAGERGDVLAVMEQRIPPTGHGWQSHLDRAELRGPVEDLLYVNAIPIAFVAPTTLKKYATGRGDADKPAMLRAARDACGTTVRFDTHDEADAFWLMAMGVQHYGIAAGPVFANVNRFSLDRIDWPLWTPREVRA